MRAPPENANGACQGAAAKMDSREQQSDTPRHQIVQGSRWRDQYKVHPAADVFPMMSDQELAELGENIKRKGLKVPIVLLNTADTSGEKVLVDGRNRLEAMERAGIGGGYVDTHYLSSDPVAFVISANIHRRHLTKQQQAELIVAVLKAAADTENKPRQVGGVSRGGRGKRNPIKEQAVAVAKEHGISERTVERSIAKSYGGRSAQSEPKPKPKVKAEPLNSLAWSDATPELRTKWIDAVGVKSIWEAMTPDHRAQLGRLVS